MNPHGWYELGLAYHRLGNDAELQRVLRRLIRFDPKMTRQLAHDCGLPAQGIETLP
jgi:hypothetical protein